MGDITIDMKILDEDYRNIGNWKFLGKDVVKYLKILNRKYNLGFKIKESNKMEDQDLDWAR